ncbi:MAG TPA: aminoglycoside phosphotransferase family protein, partial [Candidatus Saccharimonadales bacterium]|nr:aminoglycoside phosphotransferase family protein [Candidatus Saccharimonadales bacterium]
MASVAFDLYAYARGVLLPQLGLRNHPFVVKAPGASGTASRTARIVVERGPVILLRIFPNRARARRNGAALELLGRMDLPAPRLMLEDTNPANRLIRPSGMPRWVTAETWIDGTPAVEAPEKETEKIALMVASVLARYHAVTRGRWGRPGLLSDPRPYHSHVLGIARRMIRDLSVRGILGPAVAATAEERFTAWRRNLMKLGTFQLTHRDANRRNFIVPADKKATTIVPVDLQRLMFGAGSEDVADALHHFCRHSPSLARKFVNHYLEEAAPASRLTWTRTGEFFIALNALKRLHKGTTPGAPDRLTADDPRMASSREEALALPAPPLI